MKQKLKKNYKNIKMNKKKKIVRRKKKKNISNI